VEKVNVEVLVVE
jgi:tRNA U34 5-methylaminomethyl-2-thiouridine-forming methyltransferase MnmC